MRKKQDIRRTGTSIVQVDLHALGCGLAVTAPSPGDQSFQNHWCSKSSFTIGGSHCSQIGEFPKRVISCQRSWRVIGVNSGSLGQMVFLELWYACSIGALR